MGRTLQVALTMLLAAGLYLLVWFFGLWVNRKWSERQARKQRW
jgi:uncharacterized membrane protein (DUF2068 family)